MGSRGEKQTYILESYIMASRKERPFAFYPQDATLQVEGKGVNCCTSPNCPEFSIKGAFGLAVGLWLSIRICPAKCPGLPGSVLASLLKFKGSWTTGIPETKWDRQAPQLSFVRLRETMKLLNNRKGLFFLSPVKQILKYEDQGLLEIRDSEELTPLNSRW